MSKAATFALVVLVVLLAGGSLMLWQKYRTLQGNYDSVRSSQDATQLRYGDALSAIAEIQDSLSTLGVSEATRPLLPGSPASERGLSVLRGREALDRIALLKAGIERTKTRLRDLESRSRMSSVKIAGLERVIQGLRRSIAEKEGIIASLTNSVDSLHTAVTGLQLEIQTANESVQRREEVIADQRRELGTVYYVIGDRKSLTKSGAAVATGGFLGLGQSLVPSPLASESMFLAIDTDSVSVIRIPSPKARVLSAQPAASYSLLPVGGQTELRILDPHAFRAVRRVVILSQS
jgi:uncharacterized small protein (DUF1192 family)